MRKKIRQEKRKKEGRRERESESQDCCVTFKPMCFYCDIISFNGHGQLVAANLCKVKRSFKPYQNEHNSVKDTGEKGIKPCNIDLFVSAKTSQLRQAGCVRASSELMSQCVCSEMRQCALRLISMYDLALCVEVLCVGE